MENLKTLIKNHIKLRLKVPFETNEQPFFIINSDVLHDTDLKLIKLTEDELNFLEQEKVKESEEIKNTKENNFMMEFFKSIYDREIQKCNSLIKEVESRPLFARPLFFFKKDEELLKSLADAHFLLGNYKESLKLYSKNNELYKFHYKEMEFYCSILCSTAIPDITWIFYADEARQVRIIYYLIELAKAEMFDDVINAEVKILVRKIRSSEKSFWSTDFLAIIVNSIQQISNFDYLKVQFVVDLVELSRNNRILSCLILEMTEYFLESNDRFNGLELLKNLIPKNNEEPEYKADCYKTRILKGRVSKYLSNLENKLKML